eukprot:11168236-Lingulodinium_polyedra.AAC.1
MDISLASFGAEVAEAEGAARSLKDSRRRPQSPVAIAAGIAAEVAASSPAVPVSSGSASAI